VEARLRSLPLQELARRGKNIRWSPLLAKGIHTAWDVLHADPGQLREPGVVGTQSIDQLLSLAQQAARPQAADLRPPKDTTQWMAADVDLARVLQAFASVSALIGLPHCAALQQLLLGLRALYRVTRWLLWLFSTSSTKTAIRARHAALVSDVSSRRIRDAQSDSVRGVDQARSLASATNPGVLRAPAGHPPEHGNASRSPTAPGRPQTLRRARLQLAHRRRSTLNTGGSLLSRAGHHYDDTRRYVDALGRSESDRAKIYEHNARRVYPRLPEAP
jgi:hypothetical protein